MGNYEIAWNDLREALQNEESCERYVRNGKIRKEKSEKEILEALRQDLVKGGKVYATMPANNVHCR